MSRNTRERDPSGTKSAVILSILVLILLGLSLGLLLTIWPKTSKEPSWLSAISAELRLVLLVACGAALGSLLSTLIKYLRMTENSGPPTGWVWPYLFKMVVAVPLAMVMYMVLRGGLLSPDAEPSCLNPYGILIASSLVGMCAAPIIERFTAIAEALFEQESKLGDQLDRIGESLGIAVLDNYRGYLGLRFRDSGGDIVKPSPDGFFPLRAGQNYALIAGFSPEKPEWGVSQEVLVSGGADARMVTFSLIPDSDSVRLQPRQESVTFGVGADSPEVAFQFRATNVREGEASSTYELWVEVSQKNRLIQVVSARFVTAREGPG